MKNVFILVAAFCLVAADVSGGDVITLNSTLSFEGKVVGIRKCKVVFIASGSRYVIPAADIHSIQFEDPQDLVYTEYRQKSQADPQACLKGRTDAAAFHGKMAGHFLLGALFGPFAMIGTLVSNPTPLRGRDTFFLSPNKDLFSDPQYLKCYRKTAKLRLVGMEAVGFGAWLLISALIQD